MNQSTRPEGAPSYQFPNLPIYPPAGHTNLLRDLLTVLLLWALVIACFWKIALAGRVLAGGDIFTYFYPYWAEATRAIRAGRLPLWNPYLFMGVPFLANSQVGFFYPLNWPLWLLLPAHRSVHLTIVLHLCLAALNAYVWGRTSLRLGRVGAWTVGVVFALGGYLGAQVEHVNQLQGLAWLPLILVLYDKSTNLQACKSALAGLSVVVGLVLLAGHTQTAFISLVGLAIYGLGPALWEGLSRGRWWSLLRRAAILALAAGLGIALAAIQLIPTGELSRHSIRAGGLPFNERVSFSLSPSYLARALLPGFANPVPPEHIECVAYVGIAGLILAAFGILTDLRARRADVRLPAYQSTRPQGVPIYLLTTLGLFLALGLHNPLYLLLARYVPGFAHFRAPARWLALYVVGAAALAGKGADRLWRAQVRANWRLVGIIALLVTGLGLWGALGGHALQAGWTTLIGWSVAAVAALGLLLLARDAPRTATACLIVLLIAELLAASSSLPHARATAPQAFTQLRPAIAHMLAAPLPEGEVGGGSSRFLSLSNITFDPGDLAEIRTIYGPQLSDDALYDYIIAAKQKEVLSPNLPLAFGVPALDGYGGGLLPLARYVTLQRLFLPEDELSIDGRLRENLTTIPDGRWLSLFNVRHVITDKLRDAWLDGVFYDLQFCARLSRGEEATVAHVPRFEATALSLIAHLEGNTTVPEDALVGIVKLGFDDGAARAFELRAGEQMNEESVATRLRWSEPAVLISITVQGMLPRDALIVQGASLIDERTGQPGRWPGSFQSLVLSARGRFRLAHSGDVKIYENLDVLPRAFLVHRASTTHDDAEALLTMRKKSFNPATEVMLTSEIAEPDRSQEPTTSHLRDAEGVHVTRYEPERVEIDVTAKMPGYLVLTDAWYPGWEATVDGEPTAIHRANLLFRAIALDAGHHHVAFTFRPMSLRVGVAISLTGLFGLVVTFIYASRSRKTKDRTRFVQS